MREPTHIWVYDCVGYRGKPLRPGFRFCAADLPGFDLDAAVKAGKAIPINPPKVHIHTPKAGPDLPPDPVPAPSPIVEADKKPEPEPEPRMKKNPPKPKAKRVSKKRKKKG